MIFSENSARLKKPEPAAHEFHLPEAEFSFHESRDEMLEKTSAAQCILCDDLPSTVSQPQGIQAGIQAGPSIGSPESSTFRDISAITNTLNELLKAQNFDFLNSPLGQASHTRHARGPQRLIIRGQYEDTSVGMTPDEPSPVAVNGEPIHNLRANNLIAQTTKSVPGPSVQARSTPRKQPRPSPRTVARAQAPIIIGPRAESGNSLTPSAGSSSPSRRSVSRFFRKHAGKLSVVFGGLAMKVFSRGSSEDTSGGDSPNDGSPTDDSRADGPIPGDPSTECNSEKSLANSGA